MFSIRNKGEIAIKREGTKRRMKDCLFNSIWITLAAFLKEYNLPNQNGIGAQLILKTRVAVPVYVDKGKFTKKADVETFEIVRMKDGLYTKMKVVSTGNSRIRYTGTIQVIEGKKLIDEYAIGGSAVGDNNSLTALQKIDTKKITKAGDYTLRLLLSYNDENNNKKVIKKDTVLKITGEI